MSVTFCVQLESKSPVSKYTLRSGGVYYFKNTDSFGTRHPFSGTPAVEISSDDTGGFFGILASGPTTIRKDKPTAISIYSQVNCGDPNCDLLYHSGFQVSPLKPRYLKRMPADRYAWGIAGGSDGNAIRVPYGYNINVLSLKPVATGSLVDL